jgi:RNA polymerase sigma-70 factor (ECF subfamily)
MLARDEEAFLIKRAQSGDAEAFGHIVEKYEGRVYNLAFRLLADRDEAFDAAQEALVKAFRALPAFKGESSLGTWLHRITTNVCMDILRKRGRYREVSLDAPQLTQDGEATQLEIPDTFRVEDLVEVKELRALVRKAVDRLPPAQRALIVMRDYQEWDYAKIARVLGCPEGTVKSRLNRARQGLRSILLHSLELNGYLNVKQNEAGDGARPRKRRKGEAGQGGAPGGARGAVPAGEGGGVESTPIKTQEG